MLRTLEAAADRLKGGRALAELYKDPQFVLERTIAALREEARAKGEPLPMYYRIEVYEPTTIKSPGRKSRWRKRAKVEP
jgi:hypothetical protein